MVPQSAAFCRIGGWFMQVRVAGAHNERAHVITRERITMDTHRFPAEHTGRPSAWQRELLHAERAEAVVGTVKDYLVLCTPSELSQLPEGCVADRISTPEDVKRYASQFANETDPHMLDLPARRALGDFFALAAMRLSELEQARS
jgi:hypothetical protein